MRQAGFILAFFYLLSVVGYGLEFHYCLGDITDVNYALLETSCHCDDAHQGLMKGCCEEKEFFIQLDDEHQASGGINHLEIQLPLIGEFSWNCQLEAEELVEQVKYPESTGPPLVEPIFRKNCSLVFYA